MRAEIIGNKETTKGAIKFSTRYFYVRKIFIEIEVKKRKRPEPDSENGAVDSAFVKTGGVVVKPSGKSAGLGSTNSNSDFVVGVFPCRNFNTGSNFEGVGNKVVHMIEDGVGPIPGLKIHPGNKLETIRFQKIVMI